MLPNLLLASLSVLLLPACFWDGIFRVGYHLDTASLTPEEIAQVEQAIHTVAATFHLRRSDRGLDPDRIAYFSVTPPPELASVRGAQSVGVSFWWSRSMGEIAIAQGRLHREVPYVTLIREELEKHLNAILGPDRYSVQPGHWHRAFGA